MEKKLLEVVSGDQLLTWLVVAFLVGYFIYKEWPEFKRRVTSGAVKEQENSISNRTIEQRLDKIEKDIGDVKSKLERDYDRINTLELEQRRNKGMLSDQRKESEIMMRAMLGVLKGLQELGTNGPTHDSQIEIEDWLNGQSHKTD